MSTTGPSVATLGRLPGQVLERLPASALFRSLFVAFQFGLLTIAVYQFEIVSRAFLDLCIFTLGGFVVHSMIPRAWRLPFFSLLSIAGLFVVLGWKDASFLTVLALGLIALCHLPVSLRSRIALILATGALLALLRSQAGSSGVVPGVVLTLLGSMFMFRIIVYLYDLSSQKETGGGFWPVSYFFLLPNVCFPLFPVIDYRQFRATYYNQDESLIYQRGIRWIFRGIYHLLIYRLVYQHFTLDPAEVSGVAQLFQYSIASFLLYLRVSGTFHIIVGMLLLFGFNLPETHHHYYLASSFTDFWRRINIYWKEFMRRIFFFPANFRLRALGRLPALVLSTVAVFLGTWVLHSYQFFWLTGNVLLETHDSLFWATLGVLVALTMLYEDKYGAEPTWGHGSWNPLSGTALVCRTAGTFITICLLWGMWSADSFGQWVAMWADTGLLWLAVLATVVTLFIVSFQLQRIDQRRRQTSSGRKSAAAASKARRQESFWPTAIRCSVFILILLVAGHPLVYGQLDPRAAAFIETLLSDRLSARDQKQLERGYYEKLLSNDLTSGLFEHYTRRPADLRLEQTEAWRMSDGILLGQLVPGARVDLGAWTISVNSHGMRDQEYTVDRPEGTDRIAMVGASHLMGSAVNDHETFEALLEEKVKAERKDAGEERPFESLNFGTGGRSALQSLYALEVEVVHFQPDVVLLVAHEQDDEFLGRRVAQIVRAGHAIPYPGIAKLLSAQGIRAELPESVIEARVNRIQDELFEEIYKEFVRIATRAGIRPVWVYLPMTYERSRPGDWDRRAAMAADAGFTVVPLDGVYDSHSASEVAVSDVDTHPNPLGHALVAERLRAALRDIGIL